MLRSLVVALGLCVPHLCADDGGAIQRRERFLEAVGRGDLAAVKDLALTLKGEQVPNLVYHALGSPNPDVVEFLRRAHNLPINDLQVAALRGDGAELRRQLRQLDGDAKKAALAHGYIFNLLSNSPLTLAIRNGHTDAVRELVAAGAEVNEYSMYSLTPLAIAAERGHTEMVKLLLKHGAKVDAAPNAYTALMRACIGGRAEAAQLLLNAGADANAAHGDGQRPLHFAAKCGSAACVRLLLQHNADPRALAYGKDTALGYAELYKRKDVVEILRGFKPE